MTMQESYEDKEIRSWKRRLLLAWLFTIPIVILMIIDRIFMIEILSKSLMTIILLILSFPVIFIIGYSTLKSGIKGFTSLYFNMDSLITLGTIIAFLTGIASLFFNIQDYSGISAMIMSFFITGKYIETKAKGSASKEIRKLLELGAKKARIQKGKNEEEIPIAKLKLGNIMIIKPGEKIPTDGIVIKGESSVDEAMVTGESIPKDKKPGDTVIGATINNDGILYVKATKIGKDTFLAHIIELIENTQTTKIPIQRLADKITSIFVPTILIISIITFIVWLFISSYDLSKSIGIAVAVLVIACPCALGLATPTALMVSSGMGAKKGILIRKGEAIQTMKQVKVIVFDKTGTITKGHPEVREIYSLIKEKDLVEVAASLENLSEHPLGKAIVKFANITNYKPVKKFKNFRGLGVYGEIEKNKIIIGNKKFIIENLINIKNIEKKVSEFEQKGYTVMIIAQNKKVLGLIGVADDVKPDSAHAIRYLNRNGYKTIMITGDNETTAKAIADKVGIKQVIANVLPEDKANKIKEIQSKGVFVAFVGDGINDAPALKQANVGIAIGSGSDIAIEAGDIVLANSNLSGVVSAIKLSKATFRKIKQNLFWAFAYNVVAIPLAIAGIIHPIIAEIAMAASSITVITNANLLRREKI